MQHWVWGVAAVTVPVAVASQCGGSNEDGNITIENQHWAQRAPKDARDMVNWLSLVDDSGLQFGAVQRRSAFRWLGEGFWFRRDGDKLTFTFPQSSRKVTVTAKAYACEKDMFDRCLDVTWKGRTFTLYSSEDLSIGDGRVAPLAPITAKEGDCPACVEGAPDDWSRLVREATED